MRDALIEWLGRTGTCGRSMTTAPTAAPGRMAPQAERPCHLALWAQLEVCLGTCYRIIGHYPVA
jgi:hypothetical protein